MFILLVCIVLLLNPDSATKGAAEGLKMAFETVIPAILPFSVFVSALIYSQGTRLGKSSATAAFLTGLLGGYPTGCKTVCDMYNEHLIEKNEAEKMLAYTNNGGIIFALNVCGKIVFGSKAAGGVIFLSTVIGAVVTGMIFYRGKKAPAAYPQNKKMPLMAILGKSIASGGSVIINIAASFVVTYAVTDALNLKAMPALAGIGEMTKGIMYAGEINSLPLASFYFAFGGIGVFAQSAALCAGSNISMKWYLPGKIITGTVAFVVTYAIVHTSWDVAVFSILAVVGIVCSAKLITRHAFA